VNRFVVIAGGPGSGKTTLIGHLAARGFATAPEAGRAIIRQQRAMGREIPLDLFIELGLCWDMRNHEWAASQPGTVFFDHAVPGTAGYYLRGGEPVPAHVEAAIAACAYRREVFVTPPWPEIYRLDEERTQTWAEAVEVWKTVIESYTRYGYRPVEVPRAAVAERADFVLRELGLDR
jgi:predicted ATPase